MDTTETYIKMMGLAWPVLKGNMPIGSLIFSRRIRMLYVLDGEVVQWLKKINISNYDRAFPLLEQDQLQEMVCDADFGMSYLLKIYEWVTRNGMFTNLLRFTSMEQLWLAFYMQKKHGKYWDGEAWKSHET